MDKEKIAFYVVRKGDIIGVYNSLSDCQAQAGSSVSDPSLTVYKGYCLPKEAEKYLATYGLKNSLYSIKSNDVKNDLFGQLAVCPFQQPVASLEGQTEQNIPQKSPPLMPGLEKPGGSCVLYFDGASKGNPGLAGAGAVLYTIDGDEIGRVREGVGYSTNNVAEYRALILGLKYALNKKFEEIKVFGDSNLVVMQVQGLWKIKNQNMGVLCKKAQQLMDKFSSFKISHVERALNGVADVEANLGINLKDGEIEESNGK